MTSVAEWVNASINVQELRSADTVVPGCAPIAAYAQMYHYRMTKRRAVLCLLLAMGAPAQTDSRDRPFWRTVVMGTRGAVAAEHPLQARAAMRILESGGNAFDAAVALFYMTAVVEQHQ